LPSIIRITSRQKERTSMSPFRRRVWWRAARGWAVALLLIVALPLVRVDSVRAQSFTAATVTELIAAIKTANGNGQPSIITLVPGATYTLAAVDKEAPGDETGLPRITSNLTITGNGTTIERSSAAGTPHFRIFAVDSGALALNGLTIRNGSLMGVPGATHAPGTSFPGGSGGPVVGGAIVVTGGTLSVANCLFTANSATGGAGGDGSSGANNTGNPGGSGGSGGDGGSASGGAISNGGTLIVSGTTFAGNSARGGAGGSGGHGGNATGAPGGTGGNAGVGADGSGGALLNTGTVTVTNTTFTANIVVGGAGGNGGVGGSGTSVPIAGTGANGGNGSGGAIDHGGSGTLAATNATIARNAATGGVLGTGGAGHDANGLGIGGGIHHGGAAATITVANTLLAANNAGDGNCGGNRIGDSGYNLDFDPSVTCRFSEHAQTGDPGLGMLANHGGLTPTLDIATGGGATGAGNPAICAGALVGGIDQRGLNRPAQCSIGAFEPQAASFPTLAAISSGAGGIAGESRVTLTGTGFVGGATVTFGGVAATNITVANAATITATTPAHAIGAVDVVVTNPDRQAATLSAAYTFSIVAVLPGAQPPGSPGGVPGPLPAVRLPGSSSGGNVPSPLPPPR
jgi:hypothetical protein